MQLVFRAFTADRRAVAIVPSCLAALSTMARQRVTQGHAGSVKPYSKRGPRKAHVGGNSGAVLLAKVNPTDQVGIRIAGLAIIAGVFQGLLSAEFTWISGPTQAGPDF